MAVASPILPGGRIGIVGTGQLGRMMALAAEPMGYSVVALGEGGSSTPLGQVCQQVISPQGYSEVALAQFAQAVDVVTFEFENIPAQALSWLEGHVRVHPSSQVLTLKQDRLREKEKLQAMGFPVAPFAAIDSLSDLQQAVSQWGLSGVLKTRRLGYDGKGQVKLNPGDDLATVFTPDPSAPVLFEAWVPFVQEISVLGARNPQGQVAVYPPIENQHRHHVLDVSLAPARIDPRVESAARQMMGDLLEKLHYVGLLCVELFVLADGSLLVNELAPRPHNSGHLTIEGAQTSQFEQHIRAICGLPLGATALRSPCAMVNLLGGPFDRALASLPRVMAQVPSAKFHHYGKAQSVLGRKMGHFTMCGETLESVLSDVDVLQQLLTPASIEAAG